MIVKTIGVIENDAFYRNTLPKCGPQLGKRGLYRRQRKTDNMVMSWVLNLSGHSVRDFRSSTSAKPSDQAAFFDFTNDSNDSLCSRTGANEAEFVSIQRERVGSSLVCGAGALSR